MMNNISLQRHFVVLFEYRFHRFIIKPKIVYGIGYSFIIKKFYVYNTVQCSLRYEKKKRQKSFLKSNTFTPFISDATASKQKNHLSKTPEIDYRATTNTLLNINCSLILPNWASIGNTKIGTNKK